MAVGIYARISRDEARDGLGVERQLEDCRALCARRGWSGVRTYVDDDISAYSGRVRPAYDALLREVRSGGVSTVVAWAPERLHRSPRDLEDFIELIERTGTSVETVKAGAWDVSTSHGRLVARMLGAVSRAESERTGERVARAHRQAKEAGRWRGPIPFGMRATDAPGMPEPDPATAAIVEDIFERITRGDALTRVAKDLTERGVRPRRGRIWTHSGVARLVASPALGGLIDLDGVHEEAAFTGVVSPITWREANAALRRRPRGETRRPRDKLTLLGGILTCAEHGHTLYGGSTGTSASYVAGHPGQCYVSTTRRNADEFVEAVILARLSREDAADLFVQDEEPNGQEAQAAEYRARRDELLTLIADGVITAAIARPQLERLGDQLEQAEVNTRSRLPARFLPGDPAIVWTSLSMPERREVVRVLFSAVRLRHVGQRNGPRANPDRVELTWADGG